MERQAEENASWRTSWPIWPWRRAVIVIKPIQVVEGRLGWRPLAFTARKQRRRLALFGTRSSRAPHHEAEW